MFLWGVIWLFVMVVAIRTINYGRWAGKQKNMLGAIGLYILAGATILIPVLVYLLNNII